MDVEILARIQFAFTIAFHYIFPPLSIGLGVILVIMEGLYLRTKNKLYERTTKFWIKIFGLTFSLGVATGIVMEFEFGTNWATYSRYVGDIFGSALAAEGIFAFFLESGFLAILVFGWNKVSPKVHFFSTIMVALGATFSAIWIVVANSWMQTPAGYHIVGDGLNARAEITSFWEMVFNPSSLERLAHVLGGAWLAGAFLVISVSAYYILKKQHVDFAQASLRIALIVALLASLFQLFTGHFSADGVAENQPAKLAAMEGHFDSAKPGTLYIMGWVDEKNEKTYGIGIPGFLSLLVHGDISQPLIGLDVFKPEDRPNINWVFQTYHIMVAIGILLIAISILSIFLHWRGNLSNNKIMLTVLIFSVLGPQISNQTGWFTAEMGRQPWIVYGLLRTSEALSKTVSAEHVLFSIILFTLIYGLLFVLFIFLLDRKIKQGPEQVDDMASEHAKQKQLF